MKNNKGMEGMSAVQKILSGMHKGEKCIYVDPEFEFVAHHKYSDGLILVNKSANNPEN